MPFHLFRYQYQQAFIIQNCLLWLCAFTGVPLVHEYMYVPGGHCVSQGFCLLAKHVLCMSMVDGEWVCL